MQIKLCIDSVLFVYAAVNFNIETARIMSRLMGIDLFLLLLYKCSNLQHSYFVYRKCCTFGH